MKIFTLLLLLASSSLLANELYTVKVSGTDSANVVFQMDYPLEDAPKVSFDENVAEFFVPKVELHSSFRGKLELSSPHSLIEKVQATPEKGGLKFRLAFRGTNDNLKNRINLLVDQQGLKMEVGAPKVETSALSLFREEQQPIDTSLADTKTASTNFSTKYLLILFVVFGVAAFATFLLYRVLRKQTSRQGSRKYLIEQLAYCSLGHRGGVSLLKVGREFILVGVTGEQVNLITSLPELQAQYQEETRFERETFRDAVDDEIGRLKSQTGI